MDRFNEILRNAAPPSLGANPATAECAQATARAVLADASRRNRFPRLRKIIAGSALSIGILGLGATAAVAGPAVAVWLNWTPDIVAQQSFDLGQGSELGLCEVFIRVAPEYGTVSDQEADRRTKEARTFLTEHDWEPLMASITDQDIEAAFAVATDRRSRPMTDGTMPPPATLSRSATGLMFERFTTEFEQAGQLGDGVSLEAAAGPCGDASEGSTQ